MYTTITTFSQILPIFFPLIDRFKHNDTVPMTNPTQNTLQPSQLPVISQLGSRAHARTPTRCTIHRAPHTPFSRHRRGSCGTIFAEPSTEIVYKKGKDTKALRNDLPPHQPHGSRYTRSKEVSPTSSCRGDDDLPTSSSLSYVPASQ